MSYYPLKIESLPPREQVIDAINRLYVGIDDSNVEVLESSFLHSAEVFLKLDKHITRGWENLKQFLVEGVVQIPTTHQVTNFRVTFDSENSAKLTANLVAHHLSEEKGFYTVAGVLEVVVVLDEADGLRKILEFTLMEEKWRRTEKDV